MGVDAFTPQHYDDDHFSIVCVCIQHWVPNGMDYVTAVTAHIMAIIGLRSILKRGAIKRRPAHEGRKEKLPCQGGK